MWDAPVPRYHKIAIATTNAMAHPATLVAFLCIGILGNCASGLRPPAYDDDDDEDEGVEDDDEDDDCDDDDDDDDDDDEVDEDVDAAPPCTRNQ